MNLMNLALVLVVAVGVAATVSTLYATALRLWAVGEVDSRGNANLLARTGSVLCFSACVAIVLFALWLMIPQCH